MKKHWIIFLICLVAAAAICLSVSWPAPHAGGTVSTGTTGNNGTNPTTGSGTGTTGTTGTGTTPAPSVVRWYVCQREDVAVYEQLAQAYTQASGTACQVVAGDLQALLDSDTPPTIFCVHTQEEAQQWRNHMLDLSGTQVLESLYSPAFALQADGIPVALAMDVEGYGLIYNAALLAQASFTRSDVVDLESLQTVVEHITDYRSRLGFLPFSQAEPEDTALAAFLAGLSHDPAQIRSFFDLYIANSSSGGDALTQFVAGEVVFYVGGLWEYEAISQMGIHNLDILPLYTADGGGLHCVCDTYWSVNAGATAEDVQVALDFLCWLVTAGEDGAAPVDSLGWFAPFRDAEAAEHGFERLFRQHMAADPVVLQWSIAGELTQEELQTLAALLSAYANAPTEENWASVAALLS